MDEVTREEWLAMCDGDRLEDELHSRPLPTEFWRDCNLSALEDQRAIYRGNFLRAREALDILELEIFAKEAGL